MSQPTVFLIDDELSVRRGVGRLLKAAGYAVESFASAREFLQRDPEAGLACLVLDVKMPDLTGLELQQALADTNRRLPIVYAEAYVRNVRLREPAGKGGLGPWRHPQVLGRDRRVTSPRRMPEGGVP